uniref:Putative secreted peptide n=1 Tax=Anopheles braziliensis TaxID=58242 RepID=A0A2M3ZXD0_9DIPT
MLVNQLASLLSTLWSALCARKEEPWKPRRGCRLCLDRIPRHTSGWRCTLTHTPTPHLHPPECSCKMARRIGS